MTYKTISLWIMIAFYLFAGVNHFINPSFYYDLIPPFFEDKVLINILSGIAEILLAVGLVFSTTRRIAAIGIILMLLAFIPSHVYFIQIGSCVDDGLCVPEWIGWARLLIIHPVLILWAWWHRK